MAASTAAGYWPRVQLSERQLLALTYVASEQGTYGLICFGAMQSDKKVARKSVAPVTETSICDATNALSGRPSR